MSAVFRENVTDQQQQQLEDAEFANSVPVFMNEVTRVVPKGNGGSTQRVAHPRTGINQIARNAGVVMPASDKPGLFCTPGKA